MGVKEDLVTLLTAAYPTGLNPDALSKDDATTSAAYSVMVGNIPRILVRDLYLSKQLDLLFTIGDIRADMTRVLQYIPLVEDGRYAVNTWTIAKTANGAVVIDGIKLKQKADTEVKRVFRTSPSNRHIVSWECRDRLLQGMMLYNTSFIVKALQFV